MKDLFKLIFDRFWSCGRIYPQKDKEFLQWLKLAIKQDRKEVIDLCIEIVRKHRVFDNEEEITELENLKKTA